MVSYPPTWWWSKWELMNKVLIQFRDVELFLHQHNDICPSNLLAIINNPQDLQLLKAKLAAVVDIGTYSVKATYMLKGDGVLVINCYEEILKIRAAISARYVYILSQPLGFFIQDVSKKPRASATNS